MTDANFREIRFTTRDGLRLYARHYPSRVPSQRRPVVCLAGLTRNSRDFHHIAEALAGDESHPRDVYTLDTRGRGLSDHDPDWRNYAVPVEMLDCIDFMISEELADVAIIGSSRGGLIAMVMAAAQPTMIGAVVLNDIGPVIEVDGLLRISGYVGRTPAPTTWDHAARIVAEINRRQFPRVTEDEWQLFARQIFNERNGRPVPSYDAKVARSLSVLDGPVPTLWPQFDALKRVPVMVLRGENSDILSPATIAEMERRHPALRAVTVAGEGHVPLLQDPPTMTAVSEFLAGADANHRH